MQPAGMQRLGKWGFNLIRGRYVLKAAVYYTAAFFLSIHTLS